MTVISDLLIWNCSHKNNFFLYTQLFCQPLQMFSLRPVTHKQQLKVTATPFFYQLHTADQKFHILFLCKP